MNCSDEHRGALPSVDEFDQYFGGALALLS
jgi:hypothetical protein